MQAVALPHGARVGRYELVAELGRGGMAELFVARLVGLGGFAKAFAIKRILPHLSSDPRFVQMFLNEGRIAAHLSHPNVCQVYELGEADAQLFLVMEYLEGVSWDALAGALPRGGGLRVAAGVVGQICEGLHYAHELRDVAGRATSVVHRDVSPQNLFVTVDGVCKLLDFGVSKMATDDRLTRSGIVKGKLSYMPPEQIRGEEVDARADVFAAGVVLWEALAGARLFARPTDYLIWKAITEEPIPPIAAFDLSYGPAVDAVVARALARDRDQRYPSIRAFADDLRAVAAPVGGPCTATELAALVRAHCAPQLAERARQLAAALGPPSRPSLAPVVPDDAGDTQSMMLRAESIAIARAEPRPPHRRWPAIAVLASVAAVALAATLVVVHLAGGDSPPSSTTLDVGEVAVSTVGSGSSERKRPSADSGGHVAPSGPDERMRSTDAPSSGGRTAGRADSRAGQRADSPAGGGPTDRADGRADSRGDEPPRRGTRRAGRVRVGAAPSAGVPATTVTAATGYFTIDSRPYATIFVDARRVDQTPLYRVPLAAGRHAVRAVLADGRQRDFVIAIEPGKELSSGRLSW